MNGVIINKMNPYQRFGKINHLIFDVDGVFTNANILATDDDMLRTTNVRDGYAIRKALNNHIPISIISQGTSDTVTKRLEYLGIAEIYLKVKGKMKVFNAICENNNIKPSEILYMGDDLSDIPVLNTVCLAACPFDACQEVLDVAHYISPYKGGKGCIRDVVERVMKMKGIWST